MSEFGGKEHWYREEYLMNEGQLNISIRAYRLSRTKPALGMSCATLNELVLSIDEKDWVLASNGVGAPGTPCGLISCNFMFCARFGALSSEYGGVSWVSSSHSPHCVLCQSIY